MDIDHPVDVPDTPDRSTTQGINRRNGVEEESRRPSMHRHSRQQKILKEGSEDQPMVIDSGSRGFMHPPKCSRSFNNSRHPNISTASSLASSSSRTHLFRKGVTEKNPSHDSIHNHHPRSVRPSCISKSSSHDDDFVDPTERNLRRPVTGNASPSGFPGNNFAEFRKRSGLANGANFPTTSRASEETNNMSRVGLSVDFLEGVEFVGSIQEKPGSGGFLPTDTVASPRVHKQKRLVRNGCISPNNIAKAKQLTDRDSNGSVAVAHNGSKPSSAPPILVDINELVAEGSDSYTGKGKGVVTHPCSSKGPDFNYKNLHSRSSINFNEKAIGTSDNRGAGKSVEESSGWRSTRNRTREMNIPPLDEELHVMREMDTLRYSSQHHENRLERSGKGVGVANGDDKGPKLISSELGRTQPLKEPVSHHRTRLGRLNGSRSTSNALIKRQKQGTTSNSCGECSTSVPDDPEVVNLEQIIEVDEFSPQLRRDAHDEEARARQLEADERLARELQEQLYNEMPVFGVGEVDEHMSLALQHQDDRNHGFSRARNPALDARVSMSNLHRQSQSRSSSSVPRRGALARSSTLGRMTRLRSRFPGQPRTLLSSRGRTSLFPEDMDVEMRMHILGALEEFSEMGLSAGILQPQRDFNENDYEMLLALDDNNDQHGGASVHQINGLPQSTVQSENFEETCAICLETPTIGDTIRHLPCLHKFHKDCIDPWLRRKTSCPVCKSSVT
ncbi:hypothetical protein DH2020_019731 [Rehmannia glutinosa]|uniref:RING-type domain-containing protein n=1 Tax=Rehmannia glutinosa TaxID=99300 RepID=A0ABR0WE29_REHGL